MTVPKNAVHGLEHSFMHVLLNLRFAMTFISLCEFRHQSIIFSHPLELQYLKFDAFQHKLMFVKVTDNLQMFCCPITLH